MALQETTPFVKLKNPYTFGVPVRGEGRFFGRKEELQLILNTLENVPRGQKQDLVILGPRRIGKSSLLYRLLDLLQSNQDFTPVFVDVQNVKPRTMRPLFLKMLREVQKGFQHKGIGSRLPRFETPTPNQDQADLEFLIFNEDMAHLNETIAGQNLPRLVLMFDEVELLMEFGGRDTLDWFRSLIQSMPYCIFVVAGSDHLYALTQDYGSPFYNIFKTVELFPLTSDAARALIDEPAAEIGLELPAKAVDKILQVTGNTPYFIQGIAHYLVEELNRQRRNQATTGDVDKVIAESTGYLSAQFGYLWNIVSRTQQILLYALSKTGCPQRIDELISKSPAIKNLLPDRQQQLDAFDDLVRQQILRASRQNQFWFVVPLFVNWIVANVDDAEIINLVSIAQRSELADAEVLARLRRQMTQHLNLEELMILMFDLGFNYDDLPGSTKTSKVREIIELMQRHNRLPELVSRLRAERPRVDWPSL